jgi:hypothetical protein
MAATAKKSKTQAAQADDVFGAAPVVAAAQPAEKKAKKKDRREVKTDLMDPYAAACLLKKALEGFVGPFAEQFRELIISENANQGMIEKKKPDSFEGVGDQSRGNCQLKCRGKGSPLTEDEVRTLQMHKIPVETVTVSPAQDEVFFFNPAALEDKGLMAQISQALKGMKGPDGQPIVMKRQGVPAVVKQVSSDETVNAIFSSGINSRETIEQLLDIACTTAVRPTFNVPDLQKAVDVLKDYGFTLKGSAED